LTWQNFGNIIPDRKEVHVMALLINQPASRKPWLKWLLRIAAAIVVIAVIVALTYNVKGVLHEYGFW
jgi:hypothetical protein